MKNQTAGKMITKRIKSASVHLKKSAVLIVRRLKNPEETSKKATDKKRPATEAAKNAAGQARNKGKRRTQTEDNPIFEFIGTLLLWKDSLLKNEDKKLQSKSMEERRKYVFRQRMILAGVGALLGLYLIGVFWHIFHLQKNTVVNGVKVGGMNASAAIEAMQQAAGDYSIEIEGPDGSTEVFSSASLNLKVSGKEGIRTVLKKQSAFNWLLGGLFRKEYKADVQTQYDEEALDQYLANSKFLDEEQMIAPQDAALVEASDGSVFIADELEGTTIRVDAAKAGIKEAVGNYRREISLKPYQVQPQVRKDSESLAQRMEQWNGYLKAAGLTFSFPKEKVILNSKKIAALLQDDGTSVTVSYNLVAALVSEWKAEYDTYRNKFKFKTHSQEEVTIMPWGSYGYQLNEEDTAKELIDYIEKGDSGTHDVRWYKKGNSLENMGLGKNYVEISIDEQHLWVYRDGKVVVDTDIVTGNPNKDENGRSHETYLGCYSIEKKMKDVTLGTLDVQGYASPVSYWVPFNGGQGLHDAPWRDVFGGRIFKSNGSHGCVNCPKEIMGTIYKNVEIGDAVIVY